VAVCVRTRASARICSSFPHFINCRAWGWDKIKGNANIIVQFADRYLQKRPAVDAKEAYCRCKRGLMQVQKRPNVDVK
jgi:hypothetical protein